MSEKRRQERHYLELRRRRPLWTHCKKTWWSYVEQALSALVTFLRDIRQMLNACKFSRTKFNWRRMFSGRASSPFPWIFHTYSKTIEFDIDRRLPATRIKHVILDALCSFVCSLKVLLRSILKWNVFVTGCHVTPETFIWYE